MSARPKKVLFLSPTANMGGAEVVIVSIAKNLNRRKFLPVLVTQEEGPLTRAFREVGGMAYCQSLPAWRKMRNIFRRYGALRRLQDFCKQENVQLIHCNNYRLAPYAVDIAKKRKIPCVVHIHDFLQKKHIKRFSLLKATRILTVSDYVRKPFDRFSIKTTTIHNGIDTDRYIPNNGGNFLHEIQISDKTLVAGMVANFTKNKRHDLFLAIAQKIKGMHSDIKFVIAGHNAWDSEVSQEHLQQLARQKGIADDVIFTGWRSDAHEVLSSFDILFVPSKTESFPLVVLEAMASGVIVFAHKNAGGPAEQISDGVDGFLVDCENAELTTQKVVEILSDTDRCTQIRQTARDKIMKKFGGARFIEDIENLYTDVVGEKT